MRYLSVCSGIEAATVAWHSLGWTPTAFSEIEKFPSQVLAHHYPNVPNVGDMTKYKEWNFEQPINLLVGGTPCQSFSVAGLRKGLEDPRGNLALTYCGILDHFRPKWFVWENVPGVLSSGGGRDFGSFLGALAELGYGFAYRVLDAQYFGVAQRRRRVFVVGCAGDWRSAAKVLFESESLRRDSAPSRKAWEGFAKVAGTLTSNGGGLNRPAGNANELDFCIPAYGIPGNWIGRKPENGGNAVEPMNNIAPCLTKTDIHGIAQPMVLHGTQDPCVSDIAFAQGRNNGGENVLMQPIAYDSYNNSVTGDVTKTLDTGQDYHHVPNVFVDNIVAPTLTASNDPSRSPQSTEVTNQVAAVYAASMAVRRLTPMECERLQGFPDTYTDIKPNGKDTPDGPRYKALGNSMAVPVMAWIGKRIQEVENS
jgi:DNA (cytosine-5)-methyltransferase 1